MSVAKMQKVLIAGLQSEGAAIFEAVQSAGIMQVLDAERSLASKQWPELHTEIQRPRDVEESLAKADQAVSFLDGYTDKKDMPSALAPLVEIDVNKYTAACKNEIAEQMLEKTLNLQSMLASLRDGSEQTAARLEQLLPWVNLQTPLEEVSQLTHGVAIMGLLPGKNLVEVTEKISEFSAGIETIGKKNSMVSCVIVSLNEDASEIQKTLRNMEFETVSFPNATGTAAKLIAEYRKKLTELDEQRQVLETQAKELVADKVELQVLADHYRNLLGREKLRLNVPETQQTILLEGWVKVKDLKKLETIISNFDSCSMSKIEMGPEEVIPMEIENNNAVKPFETITRLHGMPNIGDVDPTVFLAPFFALFFGLCLTDAAYGIIMAIGSWYLLKKLQGDKKAIWMLLICSICTIVAGALTGGWFGDAFQTLLPADTALYNSVNGMREKIMLFDPMKDPMIFFGLSIALGYIQIMFALVIGLFNNLKQKDLATAMFNFLSWIIFLNSLAVLIVAKIMDAPAVVGIISKWLAIATAGVIFLFTERKSGMAGRIGGGVFALFSTVFYFGDILSYVRLMALGMVTAGLGIAVNILVQLVMDIPYIGWILGAVLFIGGHMLNLTLSVLSSFVHSLRLQFVEFFPKFFTGGGTEFKPLGMTFKHLMLKNVKD